ncbi:hypothetical protein [Thalassotalea ganghwensis]
MKATKLNRRAFKIKYLFKLKLCLLVIGFVGMASASAERVLNQHHASFSPKGKQMIFHSQVPNGRGGMLTQLFIKSLPDGVIHQFAANRFLIMQEPRWSPDGQWIAFIGGEGYGLGQSGLYIVRPDGSHLKQLFISPDGLTKAPSWHPDSTKIAFDLRAPQQARSQLYVIDLQGKYQPLTTIQQGMVLQPEWSPNGESLVAVLQLETHSNLMVLSVDHPNNFEVITDTSDTETMPIWGADGKRIIFSRLLSSEGQHDLFMLDYETKVEKRLTSTKDIHEFFPLPYGSENQLFYDQVIFDQSGKSSTVKRLTLAD